MDKRLMGHWISIEDLEAMQRRTEEGWRMDGWYKDILAKEPTPFMLPIKAEVGPTGEPVRGELKVMYQSGLIAPCAWLIEDEVEDYASTGIYQASPLIDVPKHFRFSQNFKALDFWPPIEAHCKFIRVDPLLVQALEEIRCYLEGAKITILSGYRNPEYNRSVGGVPDSAHIDGLAADIKAEVETFAELLKACDHIISNQGGVGAYPDKGFVHIDIRGYRSRWEA